MPMSAPSASALLSELSSRGLVHQTTSLEGLSEHLAVPRRVYAGFDPTRDSLTIGNLVSLLLLKRFQAAGHRPVVVMGGGTGLIGDPSGKDAERSLLSREQVQTNVLGQRRIFERVLDFEGQAAAELVNNAEWIEKLSFVEVLRDIGRHFSVNMMIQKDSVRSRLEGREHGISYSEFSYMILQAYDFSYLHRTMGVTVQMGGSDQWGNIVAGVDLTRRLEQAEVFGLTTPLLTKADGGKFGKTESGAIWLTRDRTSPYAFYQFWMNAADQDIPTFFKFFSLRPVAEIDTLLQAHALSPEARGAQRALAEEMTELLHGPEGLKDARAATEALFSGAVADLSRQALEEVFAGAPTTELGQSELALGLPLLDLLVRAGVAKSKREARQFLESGAVQVNGERRAEQYVVSSGDLLHGQVILLRRGKKTWHVCRVSPE